MKPISRIYDEEVTKLRSDDWNDDAENTVRQLPTFQSTKKSLYNARRTQTPQLPRTIQDINLEGKWTQTTAGEEFLLLDDGDQSRIMALATSDNLIDLCNADTLFCDRMFYTCPTQFHQIYTVHARIGDQMYPLLYSLLPSKGQATYQRLFTFLKTKMTKLNLQLNPTTVFLDFEAAAHNAICAVFPAVSLKGCFFQYTSVF
ncbi:uncharacterized protein LOC110446894 [Mizuhopecten yessoensis]|uniref:uncharacterized protein LOC110446894 n=1 Tax=Mizuhopecten yessoensis TaxID=6573 RepID=UPI000B45E1B7|nr:uncharacterized protein LOC110446894 [Mizuhopecten yessoensis]